MRLLLTLVLLAPVCAFSQDNGKKKAPPAVLKNIKVLTGMNGAQVIQVMRGFEAGLGTQCTSCHVSEADFVSDDNPKKETARMMLVMMREVNAKFEDGKEHVTCYTCHRGSTQPATVPPAADSAAKQ